MACNPNTERPLRSRLPRPHPLGRYAPYQRAVAQCRIRRLREKCIHSANSSLVRVSVVVVFTDRVVRLANTSFTLFDWAGICLAYDRRQVGQLGAWPQMNRKGFTQAPNPSIEGDGQGLSPSSAPHVKR